MPGRGHSLTIDAGWQEVAGTALEFTNRFTARVAPAMQTESRAGVQP
jgi:non-heme chloroperoxidase